MIDFRDELLDLCPHTIVWEALLARDIYGKPITYSDPQTFPGRRYFKVQRTATNATGSSDAVVNSVIWILGTPDVKYEDKVFVQGDDPDMTPPISLIERVPDEDGDLYVKVTF